MINLSDPLVSTCKVNDVDLNDGNDYGNAEIEIQLTGQGGLMGVVEKGASSCSSMLMAWVNVDANKQVLECKRRKDAEFGFVHIWVWI